MKRAIFRQKVLPYLLIAPQLAVTAIFFLWPAGQAVVQSFEQEDAFGLKTTFVGLDNYRALFADPTYINSVVVTVDLHRGGDRCCRCRRRWCWRWRWTG